MANLSDYIGATTGAAKVKYVDTAGAYTIIEHGAVDKRVFITSNQGFVNAGGVIWEAMTGYRLMTADLSLNAIVGNGVAIGTTSSSFATPASNSRGITFDGENLISCDQTTGLIYIHDGITSTVSSSFAAPEGSPSGLAFDGTNLLSIHFSGDVYQHDGVTSTTTSSFTPPGGSNLGMTFDGTNVILSSNDANLIYIMNGFSSTVLNSFSSPGTTPVGLTFDGKNLYSANLGGTVSKHEGITSTVSESFTVAGAAGLAFGEGKIIISDSTNSLIYINGSPLPEYAAIQFLTQED
jgi:hypothetical protein